MAHLSIHVLGELRVSRDEEILASFESDKVRALFAYLVVDMGRSHRRETLAGLFWPDCSEQTARHNLSQALFNLRRVLGEQTATLQYLLVSRDSIQFNSESDYFLDLEQLQELSSTWENCQGQENADLTLIEEMVKLYRGEFLQTFSLKDSSEFEEWILLQRASIHQQVMTALTALAAEYEKRGANQDARRACMKLLELDPWREEAHAHLMRLYAMDGQRSAALAQYEACKKILADELGVEPSSQTRALYEQIQKGTIQPRNENPNSVSATPVPKLPLPVTPFLGRDVELGEVGKLIADHQCRCISLVGPGGMGKTRLALEAAERNKDAFKHGAAFIPLVSIATVEAVVPAIAAGIGFSFHGPTDLNVQLLSYLSDKQMLFVLDNIEHLLTEETSSANLTDLLIHILQQAPQVKLLITSREALNIEEEWIYEVQGLDYPKEGEPEVVDQFSAVTLFAQHARRVRPSFAMDAGSRMSIAHLCRLVEGMPLAIELAAVWVRLLSPEEIVSEVKRNLDFLNTQTQNIPERHRSMRAVFDSSWQMLSVEEKQVLSRLSAFHGGFTRQAAEQVAGASLLLLSSLVIRSLVRRTGTGRFEIHELIRQYAASKLVEHPKEQHRIQERHSQYFLSLLAEKDSLLHGSEQKAALKELTEEIHNIREAWEWAARNKQILALFRASTALRQVFELRNWFKEGEQTFGRTAEALQAGEQTGQEDYDPEIARVAMLAHTGSFLFRQGKSAAAYAALSPCVDSLRSYASQPSADPLLFVYSLVYLGIVCWELGRFSESVERLQEGLRFAQNSELCWQAAHLNEFLGIVANDQGEYEQARQYLDRALTIFRQAGDQVFTAHTLSYLGRTLQAMGADQEAEKLLRESLEIAREMDYRFGKGLALDALGQWAYKQGNYPEAQLRFLESANLFRAMGDSHRLARTLNNQGMTELALNQTDEARNAFRAALTLAQNGGLTPVILASMAGLLALQVREGGNYKTLELVFYLLRSPVSNQETKDIAQGLLIELETKLPCEVIDAARQITNKMDVNLAAGEWWAS